MPKTITIKGIGRATASPDTVVLSMSLASGAPEYEKAMDIAAEDIEKIKEALAKADFAADAVKTTNFDVQTVYESIKDPSGKKPKFFARHPARRLAACYL